MPFLTVPPRRRMLSIAALTLAFGVLGLGGFFSWFHAQMIAFQATAALEDIAAELEWEGNLPQAEAVLRTIVAVKDRQAIGPLFPGGLLSHQYYFSSRADLARVLSKENRLQAAMAEYERLLTDAAEALGVHHADYAEFDRNYRDCRARLALRR